MTEHLAVLRRVGWALVVIGALDIGVMIYCIMNQISYSSSLNIFAVIAGILLIRGSLSAVRYVTWFSAFMLSGLVLGALIVVPWTQPLDYSLLLFRENPLVSVVSIVLTAVLLLSLFWVYLQLRSPAIVEARVAAGHRPGPPRSALVAGTTLAVFLAGMMQFTLRGESAEKAQRLAAQQNGADYKYFVSSMNWSGRRVSARVTGYNDEDSKEVEVEWED
jgi:hypothetical protein